MEDKLVSILFKNDNQLPYYRHLYWQPFMESPSLFAERNFLAKASLLG
jgi:hypothetical protein|tara:strand:- start:1727 stop:1870 length:144 start_codon:yes stop_codon:yes gene_type:complete